MGLKAIGAYGFLAKAHIGHVVEATSRSSGVPPIPTLICQRRPASWPISIDGLAPDRGRDREGDQQGAHGRGDGTGRPAVQGAGRARCPAH
jgi:hypothetical protein